MDYAVLALAIAILYLGVGALLGLLVCVTTSPQGAASNVGIMYVSTFLWPIIFGWAVVVSAWETWRECRKKT